ncbi:hypothetical protein [Pedobacter borealis]|uniref:hypothetical protein n=1 Tax=Pedobacter borealis TaxID=475254 RepID=UPI0004930628|nr:hypothetical protein [Pedobacter borealis]
MKKLLFIGMMCLTSTVTFGEGLLTYSKTCTVHYSRVVLNENGDQIGFISFDTSAASCSEATANARAAADLLQLAL